MAKYTRKAIYKVIIIGAGPAGLATALSLLNEGVTDILVLEINKFPRYKCCAGYVTAKTGEAFKKFGLDIADCNYSLIKDFNIFYGHELKLTVENKFLYTNDKIDRVELDYAFFKLVKSKGVEIFEDVKIVRHNKKDESVFLSNGQTVHYENLVFADGTDGLGSRYQKCKRKNIAMQLTFKSDREEAIDIHFGITERGYGWVSSKNGVTNVGLTDVYDKDKYYGQIFRDYLKSLDISADVSELKGAFTPIGVGKPVFNKNVYFVGDAVGACDPLTLSGLRYGLDSGAACARAIAKGNCVIYKRYARRLRIKFWFMKVLLKLFYLKSSLRLTFNFACKRMSKFIAFAFNRFFVNKK